MPSLDFFNKWAPVFIDLLMKDFDLDLDSACAIVGNLGHESIGFRALQELKPVVPGSKGGWGIAQWTGPRRREAEAYWKRNNLDPSNMMANYKFLFVELKGSEGDRCLPKLKAAKGLNEKTRVFSETFLRPGIPHIDSRLVWAKRALDAYKSRGPVVVDLPDTGPIPEPAPRPAEPKTEEKDGGWVEILIRILRAVFGK